MKEFVVNRIKEAEDELARVIDRLEKDIGLEVDEIDYYRKTDYENSYYPVCGLRVKRFRE